MSEAHEALTDMQLEQMLIGIIHAENDILEKRIYGCFRKEFANFKSDMLKELRK